MRILGTTASSIEDGQIVTSSLRLSLEAFNLSSYSGSGTTWSDLSVNAFSATLQNGTTFSGLDGSGCFILDGVNDYISLPTSGFGAASFSLEWWIKKTPGADVDGYIHVTDSFDNPETRFSMNATSFVATVYDGGAYRWNTSVATITTDTWYHAVATLTNGSQKFYVNGVETATNSGFYDGSGGNVGEHTFGTYNRPGAGYGGYFAGKLAAYRYYTKVLTAQEVLQNFNARKWRFGF